MKLHNIPVLLISGLAVIWVLFMLEVWAHDWKDLFFYQDNWLMYVFLGIMIMVIGLIIKKLFVVEYKLLK